MGSSRSHGSVSLTQRVRALYPVAFAAALLLSLRPAPAAAQTTDEYWRTLRAERQPTVVLASAAPAAVPEPLAESLRLVRLYEVTGEGGHARRAREVLRRAQVPDEHRAWRALALAMVLGRGPDSRMRVADGWFVDPNSLASAHSLRLLRRALELDPDFREAALELGGWALDRDHPAVAAEAIIALAEVPSDADVLSMRAELELLLGSFRRAARLALEASGAGADPAVALHLAGYALLQGRATAASGVEAYFEGARVMTEAGLGVYRRALAPLLTEAEAESWRALDERSAAEWLHRFWRRSAARAGVTLEERLAEHYRRSWEARAEYPSAAPLSTLQSQAPFALREDSRRFGLSLRGLMLVRHGDPMRVAQLEPCLSNPWPRPGAGTICQAGYGPDRLGMFQLGESLVRGDSFDPFARPLAFAYGVYRFRGEDAATDLVFAVGLPARAVNALVEGSGQVAGHLSAILIPDTGDVVRRDSLFRSPLPSSLNPVAGDSDGVALLHAILSARDVDETPQYRITVSDLTRHAGGVARGAIEMESFNSLSISDVVIAPTDVSGSWRRGDVAVALAPMRVHRIDEAFQLYYEIYGLSKDTPYRTEIELVPQERGLVDRTRALLGRDDPLRLRFEGHAAAPHAVFGVQELRTVRLPGLEPGVWNLRVVVTDLGSGRVISRGTTMELAAAP